MLMEVVVVAHSKECVATVTNDVVIIEQPVYT